MNITDTFNQNLDRARNLLAFDMAPADVGARLMEEGLPPEEAYLIVKAAQIMDNGAPLPPANPE